MELIYLDYNATAPLSPAAAEAMRPFTEAFGNPASAHSAGRRARKALEDAREKVGASLDAEPDEVIFTSGATEANNLAIFGLVDEPGHIVASPMEHPCVIEPLRHLEARGFAIDWLPVTTPGVIDLAAGAKNVRTDTQLVALMLVNHETGAIQPVGDLVKSIPRTIAVHTDAAQAVGKIPVSFRNLSVATLSASGHKFGGPQGIGFLLVRRGTRLRPLLFGGHQQQGRRPGTESVVLAVGLAAALEAAIRGMDSNRVKLEAPRLRFWQRLQEFASPVVLNGPEPGSADVVPTTLNVSFPGCRADLLIIALDLAGIACSTGSACSSGSLLPSPVLRVLRVPNDVLESAIRFSFGPALDEEMVDDAARRIGTVVGRMRGAWDHFANRD